MTKNTAIYIAVVLISMIAGYLTNSARQQWTQPHEYRYSYGIMSTNNIVTIPPTPYMSSSDMEASIKSILSSKYLQRQKDEIRITVFKGVKNQFDLIDFCNVKRFSLTNYNDANISNMLKSVIHGEWDNCLTD
ncbi:hypothetical protein ACTM5Z_004342 [Salmonella enterica]